MNEMNRLPNVKERKNGEQTPVNMADFLREITKLRNTRVNGVKEEGMFELLEINPALLNQEDAEMWYRAKREPEKITKAEREEYKKSTKSSGNASRILFCGLIMNILTSPKLSEQLRTHKKKSNL